MHKFREIEWQRQEKADYEAMIANPEKTHKYWFEFERKVKNALFQEDIDEREFAIQKQ